jgi:hypothetical protein
MPRTRRGSVTVLIGLALPVLWPPLLPSALSASDRAPGQSTPAPAAEPCDPTATRDVAPVVVEEGGVAEITLRFDYRCSSAKQQLDVVILVENSDQIQPPGRTGRQLIENVRESLTTFVEQLDFDNGTRAGMIAYASSATEQASLTGGTGGRQAVLASIGRFPAPGSPSARAAAEAIALAEGMFAGVPAAEAGAPTILLMDAGANLGEESEVLAACAAARDHGVHVAIIALESAGDRLRE